MANKGQELKKYSKETKEEVVKKYINENVSARALSEEYGIPKGSIKTWVHKYRQGEKVFVDTQDAIKGRPKKDTSNVDYKERYEILKKYQAFLKAQRERK